MIVKNHTMSLVIAPAVVCLLLVIFIVGCAVADYPYFVKNIYNCIGLAYDEDVALVMYNYDEGPEFGPPYVCELLEKIGYSVLLQEDFEEITVESLDEAKVSMVWIFGGCSAPGFEEEVIDELYDYTEEGGSLVILADNLPCTVGVVEIAKKFDVQFSESPTMNVPMLTKEEGSLQEHCITKDLDELAGGITPSNLIYPEEDENYTVIGQTETDTLFVVYESDVKRVFFDSAWTRYAKTDWETQKSTVVVVEKLIQNIADYLHCKCN